MPSSGTAGTRKPARWSWAGNLSPFHQLATTALITAVHRNRSADDSAAVRDLDLSIKDLGLELWKEAAAHARCLGCEPTITAGLRRHPDGESLLLELGMSGALTRREVLCRDHDDAFAIGWYDWWHAADRRARRRRLWQELWPSRDILTFMYPAAANGRGGLARARLKRIAVLTSRAPRGLMQAFGPGRRR